MPEDGEEGRQARDEGIERVTDNAGFYYDWIWWHYVRLPTGWSGVTETVHNMVRARCGGPEMWGVHPSVFGGIVNHLIKAGLIEATGEYRQTRNIKNHACKRPVYVRTQHRPHYELLVPLPPTSPPQHKAAIETPAEAFIRAFEHDPDA